MFVTTLPAQSSCRQACGLREHSRVMNSSCTPFSTGPLADEQWATNGPRLSWRCSAGRHGRCFHVNCDVRPEKSSLVPLGDGFDSVPGVELLKDLTPEPVDPPIPYPHFRRDLLVRQPFGQMPRKFSPARPASQRPWPSLI